MKERLFVYGTLLSGEANDVRIHYRGAELVGEGTVRGRLYDFGEYPGLRLDSEAAWVAGEIYDVPPETLREIDRLEGIDPERPEAGEYARIRTGVTTRDGRTEICWVYEVSAAHAEERPEIAGWRR